MANDITPLNQHHINNKIYNFRGVQVILDRDLAEFYQVETRTLNQTIKRNSERFPIRFMFQLTQEEMEDWTSQIVMSNKEKMGIRRKPYAFTEQGVAMLSGILKSKIAVEISIQIIEAFVQMRQVITDNALILHRIDRLEQQHVITTTKLDHIFEAIEDKGIQPEKGIFFDGQVFDAYVFISKLIKRAKHSIVLIDNYIDESVLTLLSKRIRGCSATLYTKTISQKLRLDIKKHNAQYAPIEIHKFNDAHDRFLILDNEETYHIGASLKDLGKKWFAFSKLEKNSVIAIGNKLKQQS